MGNESTIQDSSQSFGHYYLKQTLDKFHWRCEPKLFYTIFLSGKIHRYIPFYCGFSVCSEKLHFISHATRLGRPLDSDCSCVKSQALWCWNKNSGSNVVDSQGVWVSPAERITTPTPPSLHPASYTFLPRTLPQNLSLPPLLWKDLLPRTCVLPCVWDVICFTVRFLRLCLPPCPRQKSLTPP